jgi:hypothetical protein
VAPALRSVLHRFGWRPDRRAGRACRSQSASTRPPAIALVPMHYCPDGLLARSACFSASTTASAGPERLIPLGERKAHRPSGLAAQSPG